MASREMRREGGESLQACGSVPVTKWKTVMDRNGHVENWN